jgi:ATP-dependent exoDNAse (exonuclease V) beta subunit
MTTKTILYPVLQKTNAHQRDQNIQFFEEGHKYTIRTDPESTYTSVTTWNHSHFPHFDADEIIQKMRKGKGWKEGHKYWGQTSEQIKDLWNSNKNQVSGAGTDMHYEIECFMNNPRLKPGYKHQDLQEESLEQSQQQSLQLETKEWSYFLQYIQETPDFKPYRTEWTIYHEDLKLAGSIDMVYENPDGSLNIYDWKRAKDITPVNNFNKYAVTYAISHLPDSNFWHYALQLNTYKAILEEKYEKKIKDLYLVRLHPNAEEYELINLPDLQREIRELFEERKNQLPKEKV